MKTFIFVTAALLAVSGLGLSASIQNEETERMIEVRGIIENTINSTFNKIIANLSETITLDEVSIDFDELNSSYISGTLDVTNAKIFGVKSLVASDIAMDLVSGAINLTLKLSEITVGLKYVADVTVLQLVPLYGDGRINIVIDDVELEIEGKASLSGGLSLSDLTVVLSVGDSTFDLNGLINNPEFSALVSNALNDNFEDFINNNKEVISSVISPIVEAVIEAVLGSTSSFSDDIDLEQLQQEYYVQ